MSISETQLFSPYPSVFGSLVIPDTIDTDVAAGVQQMAEKAAGTIDIQMRALSVLEQMVTINCLNLGHLATVSPTNGLPISATSKIQYRRREHGGSSPFASSNHITLVSAKGALLPESVKAGQDDNNAARLALRFYALWDGSTVDGSGNPLPLQVIAQALANSPAIAAMYKLGPTTIAGTVLGANQSATVNFGLGYKPTRGNGETVAREGAIYTRVPEIMVEPKNLDVVKDLTGVGMVQLNGTVTQYFRNTSYGPAASQHASFSLVNPTIELGNISASPDEDPKTGLIIRANEGGQIVISLTATIPS